MSVYPWIPKEYYPAVMYVAYYCHGRYDEELFEYYVNKAASKYRVDREILADHARIRVKAEQRYCKYYIVLTCNQVGGYEPDYGSAHTERALSPSDVYKRWERLDQQHNAVGDGSVTRSHVVIAEFEDGGEAAQALPRWELLLENWKRAHR